MKRLGQRYVQYINRIYKRSGTLWEGHFRSCIAQKDNYLLLCQRYIELNPVRAKMFKRPLDYKCSSYRYHVQGEENSLLTPHFMYENLGETVDQRQRNYRVLFNHELKPKFIDGVRKATNGSYVLGDGRFAEQISKALKRCVIRGKAGRRA